MDIEKKKKYTDRSFQIVLVILFFTALFLHYEENQFLVDLSGHALFLFWIVFSLRGFVLEMFNEVRKKGALISYGFIFIAGLALFIHTLFFQ
ncbi:hypothetical protein LC087_19045 (plasmid) [Bacillus carboniphilus]|uniref:DUF3953 domain-containing protein n=1 Tax=Bacillus carboniphilus TaxID=86663 RepID=A0ABY9K3N4_9BACI|nr:hypothetical protein [Bacillus carboniphilus]WLR44405.1 hypothetical protein LC087_19045 [Bacillus carboniphilus]